MSVTLNMKRHKKESKEAQLNLRGEIIPDKEKNQDRVMIICAHPDDEIFGVGGTIAAYSKRGVKVTTVILSYGELTHPWIKPEHSVKTRVKESRTAGHEVGSYETIFIGVKEGSFEKALQDKDIKRRMKGIILDRNPTKIFTHSISDPHHDHRACYKVAVEIVDELKLKIDIYSFEIWNFFTLHERSQPKLFVDITDTFKIKLSALKRFKSQKSSYWSLLPMVYFRAMLNGINSGTKYSEVFYKVR